MPGGWSAHTPPEQGLAGTPSSGVGGCELATGCGERPLGGLCVYVGLIGETEREKKRCKVFFFVCLLELFEVMWEI